MLVIHNKLLVCKNTAFSTPKSMIKLMIPKLMIKKTIYMQ